MIDLRAAFEKFDDEYLKFDRIEAPVSKRPDLHAFLLLDRLIPDTSDIVEASCHDEFFLGIDTIELAGVITEDQVCELRRCGVMYDRSTDSLSMYA